MRRICLFFATILFCSATFINEAIIEDFSVKRTWTTFTDVTVGGKSTAMLKYKKDGIGEFKGVLSGNNNAGLAQAISPELTESLENHNGFLIRVKGDGKYYHLALQEQANVKNGVHYEYKFPTRAGEWQILKLPFSKFEASYFGVPVMGQAMQLETIKNISFINAQQEGKFHLEIDYMKLY